MALIIPDTVIKSSNLSEQSFRLELACWMYGKAFFSLGQGAEFCSLSQIDFMKELGKRNINWNYSIDDLREDMQGLDAFK